MRSNRTLFFGIIGLAVILVTGMIIASFLLPTTNLQQTTIQVVVAPALKPWVEQAAQAFNQSERNVQVQILTANQLIPTGSFQIGATQTPLPAAWLAEASFVVDLARNEGLPFEDARSVAGTTLAWGGYADKLTDFEAAYGPLSWEAINAKATDPDELLKLVIAAPHNSAEGLAALISATAAQQGQNTLTGSEVGAANTWLTQTLGNHQAQTTVATPAQTFASVQGRTIGDLGLLSLASWRSAGLDQRADFTLKPVQPPVALDYPFALFAAPNITPEQRQAALTFREFLLSPEQQQSLAAFFFEPAGSAGGAVQVDADAVQRLLDWANRDLR